MINDADGSKMLRASTRREFIRCSALTVARVRYMAGRVYLYDHYAFQVMASQSDLVEFAGVAEHWFPRGTKRVSYGSIDAGDRPLCTWHVRKVKGGRYAVWIHCPPYELETRLHSFFKHAHSTAIAEARTDKRFQAFLERALA